MDVRQRRNFLLLLTAVGSAVALAWALTGSAQEGSGASPDSAATPAQLDELLLDHFKCYVAPAHFAGGLVVSVTDQFGDERQARVNESRFFCNPVTKTIPPADPMGVRYPFAHLTCYRIDELTTFRPRTVRTTDQFGTATLQVLEPVELCAPTTKLAVDGVDEPPAPQPPESVVNHFKCYAIAGGALAPPPVDLLDQFNPVGIGALVVAGPRLLCNPASKNDSGIRHSDAHLTCYDIIEVPGLPRVVRADNQFGTFTTPAHPALRLCAPALKEAGPPPLGHFKCYDAKARSRKRDVALADQFGAAPAVVKRPRLLCNPVEKQRGRFVTPIENPTAHLKCYDVTTRVEERQRVRMENQFGTFDLTTDDARLLCVPSSKSETDEPPGELLSMIDHFKCYRAEGDATIDRPLVGLTDQFGHVTAEVIEPVLACNPVEKRHGDVTTPIRSPTEHLTCFTLKAEQLGGRTVLVRNQFDLEETDVGAATLLCVPSTKTRLN